MPSMSSILILAGLMLSLQCFLNRSSDGVVVLDKLKGLCFIIGIFGIVYAANIMENMITKENVSLF